MTKRGGLGSGLDALFRDDPVESGSVLELSISKIEPRSDQPRQRFDADALSELSDSIRKFGLLQPIVVRSIDNGYYQIIAGERRWRAAREAGLEKVPVRIIVADDPTAAELALVENLQREDLNPIEEARGYQKLMEDYGLTQEDVSSAVGKSRPTVANALRLLNLSEAVLSLLESGQLTSGHARALVPLEDPDVQLSVAQTVIARRLSVRQTEALVSRLGKRPANMANPSALTVDYVHEVERELENAMGRKIKLVDGKKKGHLEIEFYGSEDREKLIQNLLYYSSLRRNK